MAFAIPPWLDITPETFLGAAKAGAQIGTQRRAQDLKAGAAADRLRLAYDSLASQERRASESEQMKLELAKNAQQLRQSQMDAVNLRAQERLQQQQEQGDQLAQFREQTLAFRQGRGEMLDQHRAQMAEEQDKNRALREEIANKNLDAKQAAMELRKRQISDALDLKKQQFAARIPKLSESQRKLMDADFSELKTIEKKRDEMNVRGHTLFHPISGNTPEYEDLSKKAADLRAKIAAYAPAPSNAPHPEGTILRHKDGTRWIVKDGEPVPIDQAQAAPDDSTDEEPPPEE
jgi:hypothetical protein